MPTHAIELSNVVVDYQKKRALDSVSLAVGSGQIFGFIGPNGAGKSTTIKALLGLLAPSRGTILVDGLPPSDPRSRRRVGFLPEETHYYRFLTAAEALDFYGKLCGVPKAARRRRIPELLALVDLSSSARRALSGFSKGMMQRLGLAQALVNDPEILVLDEPTTGLDPISRLDLRRLLHEQKKKGKTVFFSSHELSEVELLCDSIAILHRGRVVKSGPLSEVLAGAGEGSLERFFVETIRSAR
jgi:ABC-2 type transport system ATP-binding protein